MSNTFSIKLGQGTRLTSLAKYVVTVFWLRAAGGVRNRPGYDSVSDGARRASRVMSCSNAAENTPVWYENMQTQSERESFSPALSL